MLTCKIKFRKGKRVLQDCWRTLNFTVLHMRLCVVTGIPVCLLAAWLCGMVTETL